MEEERLQAMRAATAANDPEQRLSCAMVVNKLYELQMDQLSDLIDEAGELSTFDPRRDDCLDWMRAWTDDAEQRHPEWANYQKALVDSVGRARAEQIANEVATPRMQAIMDRAKEALRKRVRALGGSIEEEAAAEPDAEQAERAAARAHVAAQRQAEQARRESERAKAQLPRASAAEQKAAEREAKRFHEESRLAEVASLNAQLTETYDEIDSILSSTLDVDDFVDLERLRVTAEHPPFARTDLEVPIPPPAPISAPPEPAVVLPEAPKGLNAVFARKKHTEALAAAWEAFRVKHQAWQREVAAIPVRELQQKQVWTTAEQQRLVRLEQARGEYRRECEEREAEAAATNQALDDLIRRLHSGADSAIQEYVWIVLGNSVYPEALSVAHEFEFDAELQELALTVLVSPPDRFPSEKEYKFVKVRDEITANTLPKKDLKDRYANAIYQVALRTLHEVFEADRAGHVNTIALTVATEAADPATGLSKRTPLVAVAADRESFVTFDLSNIVPLATLEHLGASVSKSPYELKGIDESRGVRRR